MRTGRYCPAYPYPHICQIDQTINQCDAAQKPSLSQTTCSTAPPVYRCTPIWDLPLATLTNDPPTTHSSIPNPRAYRLSYQPRYLISENYTVGATSSVEWRRSTWRVDRRQSPQSVKNGNVCADSILAYHLRNETSGAHCECQVH